MKLKWVIKTERYANGKKGFLGQWNVVSVDWDACRPRDDNKKYKINILLPDFVLKETLRYHETEEAAIEIAERAVQFWIDKAQLHQRIRR